MAKKKHSGRTSAASRPIPFRVFRILMADIALAAIGLCIFALPHHVLPREEQAIGTTSSRSGMQPRAAAVTVQPIETAAPMQTLAPAAPLTEAGEAAAQETAQPVIVQETVEALATVEPEVDPVGRFAIRFADKFTEDGSVIETETEDGATVYQSGNLNVTMRRIKDKDRVVCGRRLVYYVVDFYIKDISCLRSALAKDTYGTGQRDWVRSIAKNNDAIAAINGDFYGARSEGSVIRNGVLYRDKKGGDLCVLYWDGTMETFGPKDTTASEEIEKGAYQLWSFGPRLLDEEGHALSKFNTSVAGANPRTAIGYFEPGHYCFVVADGRNDSSHGLKMDELARLMESLGCKRAYNLDGGQTSVMVWGNQVRSKPYNGGRKCSDIVMIGEPTEDALPES